MYAEYYYIYVEEGNNTVYISKYLLGVAVTNNFIVTNFKSAITQ